jgi:hypothetical protein
VLIAKWSCAKRYVRHPRFPESAYPLIVSIGPTLAQIAEQDGGAIARRKPSCKGSGAGAIDPSVGKDAAAGMLHGSYWRLTFGLLIEDDRKNGDIIGLPELEGGLGDCAGW